MLKDKPGRIAKSTFSVLKTFEDRAYDKWPFNRLGVSIMLIARKNSHKRPDGRF
jgi:hypothetical protein